MNTVDNIIEEQQANYIHRKSHNTIIDYEIERMLSQPLTYPSAAKGYVNRLIIDMGLLISLRVTWLRKLR